MICRRDHIWYKVFSLFTWQKYITYGAQLWVEFNGKLIKQQYKRNFLGNYLSQNFGKRLQLTGLLLPVNVTYSTNQFARKGDKNLWGNYHASTFKMQGENMPMMPLINDSFSTFLFFFFLLFPLLREFDLLIKSKEAIFQVPGFFYHACSCLPYHLNS